MLEKIDESRVALSQATGQARKSQWGQFFTPTSCWQLLDRDSGQPRSPASLSGGEQFIAPLALARAWWR